MGDLLKPIPVVYGLPVRTLFAGGIHTCALIGLISQIKCWGYNGLGQLGLEDTDNRGESAHTIPLVLPYIDL